MGRRHPNTHKKKNGFKDRKKRLPFLPMPGGAERTKGEEERRKRGAPPKKAQSQVEGNATTSAEFKEEERSLSYLPHNSQRRKRQGGCAMIGNAAEK